jgi:hypothetical protein
MEHVQLDCSYSRRFQRCIHILKVIIKEIFLQMIPSLIRIARFIGFGEKEVPSDVAPFERFEYGKNFFL